MADRAIVVRAMIGAIVHVREDDTCRAAIVLAIDHAADPPVRVYLRVLYPARALEGRFDQQDGWYWSTATAPTPAALGRPLDSWHFPDDHDPDCRRFAQ